MEVLVGMIVATLVAGLALPKLIPVPVRVKKGR
jgi:hypothetical protein